MYYIIYQEIHAARTTGSIKLPHAHLLQTAMFYTEMLSRFRESIVYNQILSSPFGLPLKCQEFGYSLHKSETETGFKLVKD